MFLSRLRAVSSCSWNPTRDQKSENIMQVRKKTRTEWGEAGKKKLISISLTLKVSRVEFFPLPWYFKNSPTHTKKDVLGCNDYTAIICREIIVLQTGQNYQTNRCERRQIKKRSTPKSLSLSFRPSQGEQWDTNILHFFPWDTSIPEKCKKGWYQMP